MQSRASSCFCRATKLSSCSNGSAGFNASESAFEDQAEQRVLWDLEASLEKHLIAPFRADYRSQVKAARDRVRDAAD
jgi:hypothetical protein